MADDDSQKTEEPTSKKIANARSEGNVAQSRDLSSWLILFVFSLLAVIVMPYTVVNISNILTESFYAFADPMNAADIHDFTKSVMLRVGLQLLPIFFTFMVIAVAANMAQFGLLVATKKLIPKLSNLSLTKGYKRVFSAKSVVEFLKGLFKIAIVGAITVAVIYADIEVFEQSIHLDITEMLPVFMIFFIKLMSAILIVLFFLVLFDIIWQNYTHTKSLRMTRQEVKDERKQTEGSPEVKQRIAQIRHQRAKQAVLQNIPDADVVVTNPTHYAVVLKYEPGEMNAPTITGKGADKFALKIREVAEENKIPIVENPPLARALYDTGEINQEVDPDYYEAVAAVIKYVWELKGRKF